MGRGVVLGVHEDRSGVIAVENGRMVPFDGVKVENLERLKVGDVVWLEVVLKLKGPTARYVSRDGE